MPLNIQLHGSLGRMGQAIIECARTNDAFIASACDKDDDPGKQIDLCDVVIDFSFHEATVAIAELAAKHALPLVIGTTGHTAEEKNKIIAFVENKIPVVWAGNFSVGVNTLNYLTRKAAHILGGNYEPEVLEMHHHHKKDAPSGTAERLVEILRTAYEPAKDQIVYGREGLIGERSNKEIGVHSIRGGDIVGEHTVYFCGEGERIELTHRATDRKIFAQGAVRAAHWAIDKTPGIYNMEDVLGLND